MPGRSRPGSTRSSPPAGPRRRSARRRGPTTGSSFAAPVSTWSDGSPRPPRPATSSTTRAPKSGSRWSTDYWIALPTPRGQPCSGGNSFCPNPTIRLGSPRADSTPGCGKRSRPRPATTGSCARSSPPGSPPATTRCRCRKPSRPLPPSSRARAASPRPSPPTRPGPSWAFASSALSATTTRSRSGGARSFGATPPSSPASPSSRTTGRYAWPARTPIVASSRSRGPRRSSRPRTSTTLLPRGDRGPRPARSWPNGSRGPITPTSRELPSTASGPAFSASG